jgi:hypothetical protein
MSTKRPARPTQSTPLRLGNDPTLWRFGSLQEALEDSTSILAQVLRSLKEPGQTASIPVDKTADNDAEAGNVAAR